MSISLQQYFTIASQTIRYFLDTTGGFDGALLSPAFFVFIAVITEPKSQKCIMCLAFSRCKSFKFEASPQKLVLIIDRVQP